MRGSVRRSWARGLLAALTLGAPNLARALDRAAPGADAPLRIVIANHATAVRVRRAVEGAARRLAQPRCQQVLQAFRDPVGVPLHERLAALGHRPEGYLGFIVFADGSHARSCLDRRVMAITSPGGRVVLICPAFVREHALEPGLAEACVIHEALHTLGLAENPPSSLEINLRVYAHCGR